MSPFAPRTGEIIFKNVALLLAGLALGTIYGKPLVGLCIAAMAVAGWHLYQLCLLLRWLHAPQNTAIPPGIGPWPTIYSRVKYERMNVRKLRARQNEILREWREVTDALPDAGFVLNDQFQIEQHNTAARRLFSFGNNDVNGLHITNIIRNPKFVALIDSRDYDRSIRIVPTADPNSVYLCRVTAVSGKRLLLMVSDITQREQENRIRADFVGNASHELRTPLTVLHGYLAAMNEDPDLGDWAEPVGDMAGQVERMQDLVAALLQLNELESRMDAPLDTVDMYKLLRQACNDAEKIAPGQHPISLTCPPDATLLGDRSALRSIVTNLLSNAVRFTPKDGQIEVTWHINATGAHISIVDSGIGIAPEDVARVTERFYRTDHGRARHVGGSGIGLAIVKHGLSIHQASLDIQSELGSGTTFICHFPPARVPSQTSDRLAAAQS
ncbi:MAG: phosphate regulon sensor protein PhoR [Gammaproteobacteria bacterium]